MATMIPDIVGNETVSSAERRLFQRFRKELPESDIVLHSLGLAHHQNKKWGECDFVVLSQYGLFVVEVKGGRVVCEKGLWTFIKSDGTRNTKKEGPFVQAKTAYYSVMAELEKVGDLHRIVSGFGVIMPSQEFSQEGPEIILDVLMDAKSYGDNLEEYVSSLGRYWSRISEERHGVKPRIPTDEELERIRQILRPDIKLAALPLGMIDGVEREQISLTEEQSRILMRLDCNERTFVRGSAGTGKTMLAIDKLLRLSQSGRRVIYLCYNKLLGDFVSAAIEGKVDPSKVRAQSIHSWFAEVIRKAGDNIAEADGENPADADYFRLHADRYIDAMVQIGITPFDVIIIDEVQDLLSDAYIDAIELTLSKNLSAGSWHLFYDSQQDIFGVEGQKVLERLLGYGAAQFELTINCRNTKKVAVCTSMVSGINVTLNGAVDDGFNEVVYYDSPSSIVEKIGKKVDRLVAAGHSVSDMIVLSGKKRENSVFAAADKIGDYPLVNIESGDKKKKQLTYCTIKRFKGLEKRIVLAVDIEDLLSDSKKLLHYCGLSRARFGLVVYLHEQEKENFNKLAQIYGQRQFM